MEFETWTTAPDYKGKERDYLLAPELSMHETIYTAYTKGQSNIPNTEYPWRSRTRPNFFRERLQS